jgi:hypothetical protein
MIFLAHIMSNILANLVERDCHILPSLSSMLLFPMLSSSLYNRSYCASIISRWIRHGSDITPVRISSRVKIDRLSRLSHRHFLYEQDSFLPIHLAYLVQSSQSNMGSTVIKDGSQSSSIEILSRTHLFLISSLILLRCLFLVMRIYLYHLHII